MFGDRTQRRCRNSHVNREWIFICSGVQDQGGRARQVELRDWNFPHCEVSGVVTEIYHGWTGGYPYLRAPLYGSQSNLPASSSYSRVVTDHGDPMCVHWDRQVSPNVIKENRLIHRDALTGQQSSVKYSHSANRAVADSDIRATNFSKISTEEFPSGGSHVVQLVIEDTGGNLGTAVQYEGNLCFVLHPVVTAQKNYQKLIFTSKPSKVRTFSCNPCQNFQVQS